QVENYFQNPAQSSPLSRSVTLLRLPKFLRACRSLWFCRACRQPRRCAWFWIRHQALGSTKVRELIFAPLLDAQDGRDKSRHCISKAPCHRECFPHRSRLRSLAFRAAPSSVIQTCPRRVAYALDSPASGRAPTSQCRRSQAYTPSPVCSYFEYTPRTL